MPFEYLAPPGSGELRQGEILAGVYEHRGVFSAAAASENLDVAEAECRHAVQIGVQRGGADGGDDQARHHRKLGADEGGSTASGFVPSGSRFGWVV